MSVNLLRDVFAKMKVPNAVWKMPGVHDKLLVTSIIHRCAILPLKNECLSSVGSLCHSPLSHIYIYIYLFFPSMQNYICKHDNNLQLGVHQ